MGSHWVVHYFGKTAVVW